MDSSGLEKGQKIARRFVLEEQVGAGGFGTVWRAKDLRGGREVAIKALHPQLVASPKIRARFLREAEILQTIEHPNIVAVHELLEDEGRLYLVMELLSGRSLHGFMVERSRKSAPLSIDEIAEILDQTSLGLSAVHAIDVVHRDLKPANVHLTSEDPLVVKLVDFGIAKLLGGELGEDTTRGATVGSYSYMAPEQISSGECDRRTDVFSLATLIFEVMTLTRAWKPSMTGRGVSDAQQMLELYTRITSGTRPRPSTMRPGLERAVDEVFERAWSPDKKHRPDDVWAFRDDLLAALGVLKPRPTAERVAGGSESTTELELEAPRIPEGRAPELVEPSRTIALPPKVAPSPRRWAPWILGALALLAVIAVAALAA